MSNTKEKAPINWHFTRQLTRIYENLFRYFLPWYLINGLECTVQNILVSLNIKKVGGILAKSTPKKGKTITTETLDLVTNVYDDGNFSRQVPEKKNYASVSKGVYNQKLCNLRQLYTAFKKKPECKYWVFKVLCQFCARVFKVLRPKWCVLAGSKMTGSVCVCSAPQNVVLLVDAMDWVLTYKDPIKKIICNTESNKCIMHRYESCPGTVGLKEFLDQEFNEHEGDDKFNYCQWDTTDRALLTTFTASCEECKETLIDVVDDLTRHSYIVMLKITSS